MRVYLDNAATSFPKPAAVYDAIDHYQRRIGVSIGRGAYREAIESQRMLDRCRQRAAMLLGAESPERIVFTYSGTDGLNMALMGLCRPGDHVVTSELEHNSVLRPLRWLSETRGVEVTSVLPRADGRVETADVRAALRPETRLVAIQHASNVTGVVQPIAEIGEIARANGSFVLLDAAQTAGHLPLDLSQMPVDVLACPGHKGLLGPLGTGLVYLRPNMEQQLDCYRLGGTGTQSEDDRQPTQMPDRYESGNHNAPGLAGLDAALAHLQSETVEQIRRVESELTGRLVEGLRSLESLSTDTLRHRHSMSAWCRSTWPTSRRTRPLRFLTIRSAFRLAPACIARRESIAGWGHSTAEGQFVSALVRLRRRQKSTT